MTTGQAVFIWYIWGYIVCWQLSIVFIVIGVIALSYTGRLLLSSLISLVSSPYPPLPFPSSHFGFLCLCLPVLYALCFCQWHIISGPVKIIGLGKLYALGPIASWFFNKFVLVKDSFRAYCLLRTIIFLFSLELVSSTFILNSRCHCHYFLCSYLSMLCIQVIQINEIYLVFLF